MRKKAFTLIELSIVIVLSGIVLTALLVFGTSTYKQYIKVSAQGEMKRDVVNILEMIKNDLLRGGKAVISPDNRGIVINFNGKSKSYLFQKESLVLKDGKNEGNLTKFPVYDALFIRDNGVITLNIVFKYKDLNTRKIEYFKIIRDIYE